LNRAQTRALKKLKEVSPEEFQIGVLDFKISISKEFFKNMTPEMRPKSL
jgi:hypothetical protein